jgi:predicted CopG family antitoxin
MLAISSKSHKRLKQIAIDEQNYDTLRMLGHTRDSFNDVLTRVLRQNVKVLQSGQQVAAHGQTAAAKVAPTT